MFRSLKYFIVGALFMLIGFTMTAANANFLLNSEHAQLEVVRLDLKIGSEGKRLYRPKFALVTDEEPRPEYEGGPFMSPKPHDTGDVVAGRCARDSGRMKSYKILGRGLYIGSFFALLGFFASFQGILIAKGVPEGALPFRVSVTGSRRRRSFLFR